MHTSIKEIADWLRDAHAMEANLASMLDGQAPHLADFPDLQGAVMAHAAESRKHAEMVEAALRSLGEDTSALKDGISKLTGKISPLGIGMASDAPVKIVLANFAAEHFEIACYQSLEAAAEHLGLIEIAATCRSILQDEERMVALLAPAIREVTETHLLGSIAS
jgi:ferritin-like metal-binding protein YciE